MNQFNLKRGAIVFVKNPFQYDPNSHVMQGDHYAVICQNDMGNAFSDSIIVCYVTSKVKRLDIRTNICLQFYEGLDFKPAMVKCSQIMTVDKQDIVDIVDYLRPEDEIRFNDALKASLSLAG